MLPAPREIFLTNNEKVGRVAAFLRHQVKVCNLFANPTVSCIEVYKDAAEKAQHAFESGDGSFKLDKRHYLFDIVEVLFAETKGKISQLPTDSDADAKDFVNLQTLAETRIGFTERPIEASRYFPPLRAGVVAGGLAEMAMDDDDDEDNEQGGED